MEMAIALWFGVLDIVNWLLLVLLFVNIPTV